MKQALKGLVVAVAVFSAMPASAQEPGSNAVPTQSLIAEFSKKVPREWGERVPGVKTRLETRDKVIALTLDACGSAHGKGFDSALIAFLEKENIPATLFINARWIDANHDLFLRLAANPLFEIGNHGLRHRPASVTGRSIYGINGTKDVAELIEEIEGNGTKIESLTGRKPKFYRSGTAYYDEVAVDVAARLGYAVAGFDVLGDAGATYGKEQVERALLGARPGSIVILHMNHPEGMTAAGVIAAIPELRKRGFSFARLSDYRLR